MTSQVYDYIIIIYQVTVVYIISPVIPAIFTDIVRNKLRDCSRDTAVDELLRPLNSNSRLIVACSSVGTDSKNWTILFNSSPIFSRYFQTSLYELQNYKHGHNIQDALRL